MSEELARQFHEAYERLAPQFSYTTREASAKPWDEVPHNNQLLMIAVTDEIENARIKQLEADLAALKAQLDEAKSESDEANVCAMEWMDKATKLNIKLKEANEKLRWRKWPDEKPMREGFYLCDVDGGQHTTLFYYHKTGAWHLDDLRELPKTSRLNSWLPIPTSEVKKL